MPDNLRKAIVVIDVQGNLAQTMVNKIDLFRNLNILVKGAKILDLPVIWMEQLPDKLGSTIPEIQEVLVNQKPIIKNVFSCVQNDEFLNKIEELKINHFYLAGIETHVCVYQTAVDLLKLDHGVDIIVDAVSSRTELNKKIGLERINSAGGQNTTVETLLFEHQKVAEGEQFRKIIKLIK